MPTQRYKLENFDRLQREHDKLHTAMFDLTCHTRFPFVDRVTVDGAKELDEMHRYIMRVSVSRRAMPVYMVEFMDIDGDARNVAKVEFWTEGEIQDNAGNGDTFFRVVRHAIWKQGQLRQHYDRARRPELLETV